MASTYSPNLRLELIGTGEQQGTWGNTTNTNLGTLLEEAIGGYVSVTVSDVGDTTLTENNGAADQSRNMTLNLTGALTGARNVICPAIEKVYVVKNATTGGYAVTVKVSGQTGVSIPNGSTYFLYVDGTDVRMITGSLANQLANSVSITGGTITGITDLAVADGGTGASTAAGAATNLGLGTGDSPQFTAVNIGSATDTTITRSSAGVIAVEGGIVPLENRTNTFSANQIIEVTDNTNAALRVTQLGTGNAILVEDSANPDSTPFLVDSSGVVVIGSTSPESLLTNSFLQLIGDNGAVNANFMRYQTSANASTNLTLGKSNGTKSAKTSVSAEDRLGNLQFSGYDGTAFINAAQIHGVVDGTPGTSDMPGRLVFLTTPDGSSSPAERMRIRSDGNIGIGGTGSATTSLSIQKSITGATSAIGIDLTATVQSDVTSGGLGYNTSLSTQAASFSTVLQHYRSTQGTLGAGSTVSLQIGFSSTASLIGATDNQAFRAADTAAVTSGKIAYGFYSAINTATGGGTTYGFYAAGTARNLFSGDVQVFGAGGLGYTTGSGGAVTQGTSRTTGVTLNKTNGAITLVSAAGSTTWQSFTVTNSTVAATDTVIVSQKSGTDLYMISVTAVAAGSFRISFATTGGTTTEQPVFNFAVIKAVTA